VEKCNRFTDHSFKKRKTLLGLAKGGFMDGFLTPVGGKVDKRDKTIEAGARRELWEETGVKARKLYKVGTILVKIVGPKWKVRIHVFKCSWSGRISNRSGEFTSLRFYPTNKIPWDKFIPGDRDWLEKTLKGQRIKVRIICGENRADLQEICVTILP
jgi:8-oxo-dGTP pyrophosphatase MutT (NUDIX family)